VTTPGSSLESWLEQLPRTELPKDSVVAFDALLLPTAQGQIRLVVESCYLDVDEADVVRVEERSSPGEAPRLAVRVHVAMRPGFRVIRMGPSWMYRDLFARRPFAISSRPDPPAVTGSAAFRAREQRFLRLHGIDTTDAT
jgi:hypothetical protein